MLVHNELLNYILKELENSPNRSFRVSELKRISSTDFDRLLKEKLLKYYPYEPEGDNYPCADGCASCEAGYMRSVTKVINKWEAVCPDEDADGKFIPLTEDDITKHYLDIKAFIEIIRKENSLSGKYEKLDDRLYFIGTKEVNKQSIALILGFLNKSKTSESLLLSIPQLLPDYQATIILFPFFKDISQNTKKTLEDKNVYLEVIQENNVNITSILNKIIPKSESAVKTPIQFPLPDGIPLSNVTILFDVPNINTGSVSEWIKVSYPGRSQRFHYAEIGCKDKKSGKYDKQWEILYAFAQNHGIISWAMFKKKSKLKITSEEEESSNDTEPSRHQVRQEPSGGFPALEKRIQALKQILKQFLNTQEDPFYPYSTKDGYRTKFKIEIAEDDESLESEAFR